MAKYLFIFRDSTESKAPPSPEELQELQQAWQLLTQNNGRNGVDRRGDVDLFSMFSGKLAVQESLQLDALVPPGLRGEEPPKAQSDKMGYLRL